MSQPIIVETREQIVTLRVNRPRARNALNWAAQERFAAHITRLAGERDVRALIITGTGDSFISGGDLKELARQPDEEAGQRLNDIMTGALAQLVELPFPVIAAVNGHAVGGGCEVLTACDLRLGYDDVQLKWAQVHMGLTTGWGGAARLVRQVGQSRALELLLTGRALSGQEALRLGILHRVVSREDDVHEAAFAWARSLARLPREALAALKQLVHALPQLTPEEHVDYERELFNRLWGRPDHLEALAAFLEKRRPSFGRDTAT
ncbi:MAG TPA: enoyl-CoA hydratase/isomerase family protein [Candidatus Sulfomarinibacteraceae bacterium]|nr:enoyl-CoA hydratase/isomerase family protein [Candidatus Sulfomarinibacteraceae bacterium]